MSELMKGDWFSPKEELRGLEVGEFYEVLAVSEYAGAIMYEDPNEKYEYLWCDKEQVTKYEPRFEIGETVVCTNLNHLDEDWEIWVDEVDIEVGKSYLITEVDGDGDFYLSSPYTLPLGYFKPIYPEVPKPKPVQSDESALTLDGFEPTTTNQPTEEEVTMPQTNQISTEVTNAPCATKQLITLYGKDAAAMSEDELCAVLTRIKADKEALGDLDTGEASKRITAKIKALDDARTKVIELIDALDDE